jgi:meso-butanediol dehydrogenase/(S,S)-butanediol dehydrogenase/diacetyl reductase
VKLAGIIAIVTGAGRGIGRGIALTFAREGADVAIASRTGLELETLAEEIRALGRRVLVQPTDVTQEDQVQLLVDRTLAEFGRVDVLVNNAGTIVLPGDILQTSLQAWEEMMAANARSVFLCCKAVLQTMIECRKGKIINISSAAGLRGLPDRAAYCASKFAVIGFTEALALDMKPYGIAVNAICPGAVDTPLTSISRPDDDKTGWMKPKDIADVALFLASDDSRAMTGAIVEVSGWAG